MSAETSIDYRRLSVAQRLELVESIWNSIDADAGIALLPLTSDEQALLDDRLTDLTARPDDGEPWTVVRDRILSRR